VTNLTMEQKWLSGDTIDICSIGKEVSDGLYELNGDIDANADYDYCDIKKERWIWSFGRRLSDGKIFASISHIFYQNPEFECIWLR
jgi:hypothetical protein